jgi:hypothetical protein
MLVIRQQQQPSNVGIAAKNCFSFVTIEAQPFNLNRFKALKASDTMD